MSAPASPMRPARRRLAGGLILRTATADDVPALAEFNVRVHGDEVHRAGTWDALGGGHPLLNLGHQLVVEDPTTGAIVSAAFRLPMRWRLGSVELPVSQIEAVGTDRAYRRRGLSRTIIEALHATSDAHGDLLTGIVGVRYLYRRFGYEYAVPMDGMREQPAASVRASATDPGSPHDRSHDGAPETHVGVRTATVADADVLDRLRRGWTDGLDLVQVIDGDRFRFDIAGHVPGSFMAVHFAVAVDDDDRPIAYVRVPSGPDDGWAAVTEVILGADCLGREASVVRLLASHVLQMVEAVAPGPVPGIRWWLGAEHPVYGLLEPDLGPLLPPYAWYIRIPDAAALLRALAPVIESRLAASSLAGFDGTLTIDRWIETLRLDISLGRIANVVTSPPRETDGPRGDMVIPPLLFAQLVLGYRTVDELRAIFPDVWRADRSAELMSILFPRLQAWMPVFG